MWRSSTSAAPRAVARDSLEIMPTSVTGESFARLILMEPLGRAVSCATRDDDAPSAISAANSLWALLRIYAIDRHVAGFRIDVASPHDALRAGRERHIVDAHTRVHQAKCLIAGADLNSIRGAF